MPVTITAATEAAATILFVPIIISLRYLRPIDETKVES
jgi:hypothetical protein